MNEMKVTRQICNNNDRYLPMSSSDLLRALFDIIFRLIKSKLIGLRFFGGPFFFGGGFWMGTIILLPVSVSSSVLDILLRDRAIF